MLERVRAMSDEALLQAIQRSGGYGDEETESARAEAQARGLLCQYGDVQFKVINTATQEQEALDAAQLKRRFLDGSITRHSLIYVPSKDRWVFLSSVFDVQRWSGVVEAPRAAETPTGQFPAPPPPPPPASHGIEPRAASANGGHASAVRTSPTNAFQLPTKRLDEVGATGETRSKFPVVLLSGIAVGLLFVVCIAALLYFIVRRPADNTAESTGETTTTTTTAGASSAAGTATNAPAPAAPAPTPRMLLIQGGSYEMGRSDISARDPLNSNQYPAHQVSVGPFYIDATEVTNAEYADFVRETGHEAPKGWDGNSPPSGREQWPVTNVSAADAEAFAAWRSRRDGVTYRLPTEEEWEYAARGASAQLYPWGSTWAPGRANVESDAPRPVGSFPAGATPQGVQDMLGNVWEWTSSRASIYAGNTDAEVSPDQRDFLVTRGGSYKSRASGDQAITATRRSFMPPSTKSDTLGFRLVRAGS